MLLGDNMILNTFGDRIKYLREKQTISQSKLAQITGIVREQISRIENGQINPTLDVRTFWFENGDTRYDCRKSEESLKLIIK